jgi:hypothetical protein
MLLFDCPDEEMVRRIVERGKSSGRSDDNAAVAWKRIGTFREQSKGPLEYFSSVDTHALILWTLPTPSFPSAPATHLIHTHVQVGIPQFNVDAMRDIDYNVAQILSLPMFKNKTI